MQIIPFHCRTLNNYSRVFRFPFSRGHDDFGARSTISRVLIYTTENHNSEHATALYFQHVFRTWQSNKRFNNIFISSISAFKQSLLSLTKNYKCVRTDFTGVDRPRWWRNASNSRLNPYFPILNSYDDKCRTNLSYILFHYFHLQSCVCRPKESGLSGNYWLK